MEKISLFNYEVFYLDYLEGNLNAEDTALLMDFLEKHPECLVDDSILDSQLDEEVLNYGQKHLLKEADLDGTITSENIDHFLVAYTEGLLSDERVEEVLDFVEKQDLDRELKLSEAVYFEADNSITYQHKESLKQDRRIVIWPYVASVAAVGIIAFLLLWNPPVETVSESPSGIAKSNTIDNNKESLDQQDNTVQFASDVTDTRSNEKYSSPSITKKTTEDATDGSEVEAVPAISSNPVRPIVSGLDERKLAAITKRTYSNKVDVPVNTVSQDYASAHFSDMNNPIKPLTKLISDKTKTDVDFRSRKASKKKPGGFYIKIGRFEVSRKKH